jgi:hypothetical protein
MREFTPLRVNLESRDLLHGMRVKFLLQIVLWHADAY